MQVFDRCGDLLDAAPLFRAANFHLFDQGLSARSTLDHTAGDGCDDVKPGPAFVRMLNGFFDEGRGVLGGLHTLLRQIPDLIPTTAKPIPASPARAASTAAFKARIFV